MMGCSRRMFFAAAAGACCGTEKNGGKGREYPSDAKRFLDAATEFPIRRLTSPDYATLLASNRNRTFIGRNAVLLASDRGGSMQIFRLELKSGDMRQLTSATALDPESIALFSRDRMICYFDGAAVRRLDVKSLREHEIYRIPEGVQRTSGVGVSSDADKAYFVERERGQYRLCELSLRHSGLPRTVLSTNVEICDPAPRPGRGEVLYRGPGGTLHLAALGDSRVRALSLARGWVGPAYWAPGGATLLYLHAPSERELHTIREFTPETGEDKLIAKTTQFIDFAANADSSVFVGASGSLAAPHILILLRTSRRELPLCEHRARRRAGIHPLFSPDSQRVLFQTDRFGKPSVFEVPVDRFVAETQS
jgi:oligogalacturonide lyase